MSGQSKATRPRGGADPGGRQSRVRVAGQIGWLVALLVLGLLVYPVSAFPLQSLGLETMLLVLALIGLALGLRGASGAGWPFASGLALALWAALRWSGMLVSAPGRDGVLCLVWMGVAMIAGRGLLAMETRLCGPAPCGSQIWPSFRRACALAAIGFGLLAIYQYFISYPDELAHFQASQAGGDALYAQSIRYALEQRRVAGQLGNPNHFAAQLAVLALMSLSLLAAGERRHWMALGGAGYALALAGLVLTQSRGGFITFALATLAGAGSVWRSRGGRGKGEPGPGVGIGVTRAAILLASIGLLAWAADAFAQGPGLMSRIGNISTIRERIYYWGIALKVWALHPVIGSGPGGFLLLYAQFKPDAARESQFAHSWVMQAGADLGAVGLLFWTVLFAGLLRVALRARKTAGDAGANETWWLACGALLLGFDGLFEFSLQMREFAILFGLLAGGALGMASSLGNGRQRAQAGKFSLVAIGALALCVLAAAMTPRAHMAQFERWAGEGDEEAGEWQQAYEAFGRAAAWLPDEPAMLLAEARALQRTGQTSLVWPLLVEAADLNPYPAAALAAQAEWLASRGDRAAAIERLGQAIDHYPNKPDYLMRRAEWLLDAKRTEEARADLETIARRQLPLWEYQQPVYAALRARAGLSPIKIVNQ